MRKCSNCSAPISPYKNRCEFCGNKIDRYAINEIHAAFIKNIDEQLRGVSTPVTYLSFLFLLVIFPVGSYFLTRYLGGKVIAGVIAGVVLCGVGLVLFGGVVEMEGKRYFENQALPKIKEFQKKHQVEDEEFIETAKSVLEKKNGLLQYLHRLL